MAGALCVSVTDSTVSLTWDGTTWAGRIVSVSDSAATFWATLPTFGDTSIHLTLTPTGRAEGIVIPKVGAASFFSSGSSGTGLVRVPDGLEVAPAPCGLLRTGTEGGKEETAQARADYYGRRAARPAVSFASVTIDRKCFTVSAT